MNYPPNTIHWRKDALVLADSDAKEPKMLMKVIGYTRDGLCKTQYLFKDRRRTIWKNELKYLHDPRTWMHSVSGWVNHTQDALQEYQLNFERVRRWNRLYAPGQQVITTSADGGFETETYGSAFFNSGNAWIYLRQTPEGKAGCWWALRFVKAIQSVEVRTIQERETDE